MAPEKRNKFLEAEDSDDDDLDQGYDSEAEELRKGGRSAKRRKFDSEDEDDFSDEEHDASKAGGASDDQDGDADEEAQASTSSKKQSRPNTTVDLPDVSKPLTKKNLVATEEAIKKSGVVYISRIPPFMKPQKLRSLLEPYGKINRIFLAPEDPAAHARRVKNGGNKKKSYTEGWVEFLRKRDAKAMCELLNARTIGGKKGSYYHDDIWTLKYLKGFKWRHLTEQISAENAERTSRMRAEISKASKENKEFVRNVERARVMDGIAATKAKRSGKQGVNAAADREGAASGSGAASGVDDGQADKKRTVFKQIPLADRKSDTSSGGKPAGDVARVLGKIF
ncbi:RNA recognition domain-containing protein [Colletotrichum graminicola]|uniref:18S rRNA factor 2 n=1 Tax=Colletotrichum graminicola (strain M1.001 / M2 / FGSC 10212) TaxID=645133 RepID=E3QI49_COLGM|nr:RNA recognition domain-containing protein [Colletotrichum graminicola M1.001]EFQ30664.1 RNA recognition domain-containing protein [Colletotrichum graminicola M1.001]WDK21396.1 RNA recognition domain-containing protein [Colletotrichum graminicola]